MRTYKVAGMTCGGCETAVTRQLGEGILVEADAGKARCGSAPPTMRRS